MKALRPVAPALLLSFATTLAWAHPPMQAPAQTPAQKSFDLMKSLAGTWEGTVTMYPGKVQMHSGGQVILRVTSSGNAILHEMKAVGRPDDPITMLYLNDNHLYLTHYCDAGNRPRMVAKSSPDGKAITFSVVAVSGSTHYGYMEHVVFTKIGANHHTEDWTFLEPGNRPMRGHFDLHRVQ